MEVLTVLKGKAGFLPQEKETIMHFIGLIIAGLIVGALARFFLKGDQNMGMIATTILGALGTIVGYYLAGALGVASTNGVDWIRWIISIAVAMVFISAYIAFERRNKTTV